MASTWSLKKARFESTFLLYSLPRLGKRSSQTVMVYVLQHHQESVAMVDPKSEPFVKATGGPKIDATQPPSSKTKWV